MRMCVCSVRAVVEVDEQVLAPGLDADDAMACEPGPIDGVQRGGGAGHRLAAQDGA